MILVLFMYQVFIFLLGILRFFRHLFFTFMENLFINHPIFCNGSRYVRRAAAPEGTGDKVLSVHPSLCPSVPPLEAPQRADPGLSEADPGLLEAGPVLSEAGPELGGPALRSLGPPLRGLGQGGMDEWMDVQIPPVLQDFVSSSSLRSCCPKTGLCKATLRNHKVKPKMDQKDDFS